MVKQPLYIWTLSRMVLFGSFFIAKIWNVIRARRFAIRSPISFPVISMDSSRTTAKALFVAAMSGFNRDLGSTAPVHYF